MAQTETLEQVQKVGKERLNPSLSNPNWLVLRARRKLFWRWLQDFPRGMQVLDVGGRIQPYRVLLGDRCAGYTAIDLRVTPLVNVVGQAEQLPFAGEQFDLVFCTQVLEYVPNPQEVIAEMRRVLKPGGFLLLSAPAVFPRDSDVEYWRFLPCALRKLLSAFSTVDLAPEGNSVIGFIRTVNVCLVAFMKPAFLGVLLRFTVVPLLNLFGALLESLQSSTDDRFTANFSAMARK
jgi:SAM-dependent methyltransferase